MPCPVGRQDSRCPVAKMLRQQPGFWQSAQGVCVWPAPSAQAGQKKKVYSGGVGPGPQQVDLQPPRSGR
jgi:hypothetical protein